MTLIVNLFILAVFIVTLFVLYNKYYQRQYREFWINKGREDARERFPYRYEPKAMWIRKYYDYGYEDERKNMR